jgi:hypothetical protein
MKYLPDITGKPPSPVIFASDVNPDRLTVYWNSHEKRSKTIKKYPI